jgi:spermidine synthase
MYLSNSARTKKLILSLLLNPQDIISYLRYSLSKKTPLEIGLPWWSYKSINTIAPLLKKEHNVFEWGSGGSTLFLAKRTNKVVAVENNPGWFERVQSSIKKFRINNVQISHQEINLEDSDAFMRSPYANYISGSFDIIVIDGEDHFGPSASWSAREYCFEISQSLISSNGGIIIVDDSWRYPKITTMSDAKEIKICESTGPCRKGVTRTDLHFY